MIATLADFERVPRILRLDLAGQPVEWLSWQDAVTLYARDIVVWTLGEAVLRIRGGYCRARSVSSSVDVHSIIACDGKVVPPARGVPPLTNQALFRRDLNVCLYCGGTFADGDLTRDHVVPLSRAGRDGWDNVVAACKRCNQRKGNRLPEEAGMEMLAVPYQPNTAEWLALINSDRIRGDQMEFLRTQFSPHSRWS
jgi:5-methylcytosine-specific restriction endonuclease McrA